jgi:hypothetical protein
VIDVAFIAREETRLAQSDIVRAEGDVVLVANAYAHGFSTRWPEGSRLVLDLFGEKWRDSRSLDESFAFVRLEFPERARSLGATDDELAGGPGASLLAAHVAEEYVDVRFIGPEQLVVVRDGVVVSRTTPDTLVERARAQGFDMNDSPHRAVLTRTIGVGDILDPGSARFMVALGDRIVIATEAVDRVAARPSAHAILDGLEVEHFGCVCVIQR